jgi:hypothetical protein
MARVVVGLALRVIMARAISGQATRQHQLRSYASEGLLGGIPLGTSAPIWVWFSRQNSERAKMGNSGVGMLLGDTSVTALWMMFIGAFILGGTILYGVMKTGRLRRSERAQLDRNTETGAGRPGEKAAR